MKKIGIYVHIPFCKSKCKYCNFVSFVGKEDLMEEYIRCVVSEIKHRATKDVEVDTIYIGGGTPSFLINGGIATIISAIRANFNVLDNAEISIECNPNSVDYAKAKEWFDAGINRVSVGLQSVKSSLLNVMGRTHTKADFVKAIDTLKSVGFRNINVDIMIGIPKQKLSDVKQTLFTIEKLGITHVSCYSLILENGTPMQKLVESNELKEPKEEKTINMYSYVLNFLKKHNFNRYEVSNFALKGFECKHNVNTWHLHEYIGIGASAHGFFDGVRYANKSDLCEYIRDVSSNGLSIDYSENQTNLDIVEEYIMLGMRLKDGIDLNYLKNDLGYDLLNIKQKEIEKLKNLGLIDIVNDQLFATDSGFYVLNAIILELV